MAFGAALAHAGLGDSVLGIVAVSTFQTEHVLQMKQGEGDRCRRLYAALRRMREGDQSSSTEDRGHFTIARGSMKVADVWSAKRIYTAGQMPTAGSRYPDLRRGANSMSRSVDPTDGGGIVVRIC